MLNFNQFNLHMIFTETQFPVLNKAKSQYPAQEITTELPSNSETETWVLNNKSKSQKGRMKFN